MTGREVTVSDEDILRYIQNCDAPVVGTSEVADQFGFSTNTGARKRLYKLAERDLVDFKKLGRVPAFWITDEGREYLRTEAQS